MDWSGAAELAALILMVGLIWAAGVAWIKVSDFIELKRLVHQRQRYAQIRRGAARDVRAR